MNYRWITERVALERRTVTKNDLDFLKSGSKPIFKSKSMILEEQVKYFQEILPARASVGGVLADKVVM